MAPPHVITIGNFDGVHIGHAALFDAGRSRSGGAPVTALVFDPHPLTRIRPRQAPQPLTTYQHRVELLHEAGVTDVRRLAPSDDLLALSPRQFIQRVVEEHRPSLIVEGADFRFGKAREGDTKTLAALGGEFGFEVEAIEPVQATLSDQSIVVASSSMTRWLVRHGRVEDAAILLGRPYEMRGSVVQGDRRGREIGFPTANLDSGQLAPEDGIYAGSATLPDGREFPAAISVGVKPTFGEHARTVEAYIPCWDGPVAEGDEEYGWPLKLRFFHWLRDQARYGSINSLVRQIRHDVERTVTLADERGVGSVLEAGSGAT